MQMMSRFQSNAFNHTIKKKLPLSLLLLKLINGMNFLFKSVDLPVKYLISLEKQK